MITRVYRQVVTIHSVSFYFLLVTCVISLALISTAFLGWKLWQVGLIIVIAWFPLIYSILRSIYKQSAWLSIFSVLVVTQSVHFIEHAAQMVQIHLLGLHGPQASGIFGMLNTEWVHFLWNSWVLILSIFLMFFFRKNIWLWMLFIFAIWHEIEHIYIMSVYLRTHIEGTPGLISRGGAIGGGLPLSRPDVHFFYAVIEETLLLLAYYHEIKTIQLDNKNISIASRTF